MGTNQRNLDKKRHSRNVMDPSCKYVEAHLSDCICVHWPASLIKMEHEFDVMALVAGASGRKLD